MATANDTKPNDPLVLLCQRYEALARVSGEFLGFDSPVLVLLEDINSDFRVFLDALDGVGTLS